MIDKLLNRLFEYVDKIIEGKIPAGKKHIQACKRFLNDMKRLEEENSPYYFDATELEDFYEWALMFKHTKGILAGKPIELTDFQLFIAANLFCWKRKVDNTRRFRKAYIQLARKNAKTQILAIITSYVAFLSEEQEECYIAGWSREQSDICYNEVLSQIRSCDLLKDKYSDSYNKITHKRSGSVIQALSREARTTGDGKNPSVAVIDEYHAHKTSEIYDVMVSGMVARKNPLIVIITTAGFDLSSPCYTEYKYVSKIVDENEETENEEYFVMICELDPEDDIKDESNWMKANPIVATYQKGIESIKSELKIALDVPEKMRSFLTKNMNRWVDQKEDGYLDINKWRTCVAEKYPDIRGMKCYIGLDLSATQDLTSVGISIPLENSKYAIMSHSFIPEDRMREKIKVDKVRYDLWKEQGFLTATPGTVINYHYVEQYILNLIQEYHLQPIEICYDKWNAMHLAQSLENKGFTTVEIPQRISNLSLPTKDFRECVYLGRIIHNNNPVLNWAVNNAVVKMDHQENIMISKKESKERIDPLAALINAHARAMHSENNIDINDYLMSDSFSF